MHVVLLGGPGSGKGTQAELLTKTLPFQHIASGDLFREHLQKGTLLGRQAKHYLDRGELVPDEITIATVRGRLAQLDRGQDVLLDGFPRTVAQAQALQEVLREQGKQLDLVIYIVVSRETLLARLTGRLTCRQCGAVFHKIFNPPRQPGRCDVCGGELYQRSDDAADIQQRRIDVYQAQTAPLVQYYREQGLLVEIDGEQDIPGIHAQLLAAIRAVPLQVSRGLRTRPEAC